MPESSAPGMPFGCEEFGRLTRVLVHRPGRELELVNDENHERWLFDRVPDVAGFVEEHGRYCELLASNGVEVLELGDHVNDHHDWMAQMPNLTYLHDIAVITRKGAILSAMAWDGRKREEVVVREALGTLGIPIFIDFDSARDAFEGCLLLSTDVVLVVETERHSRPAVLKFVRRALGAFREVIYVDIPKARRFMHPDTVYNRVSRGLAVAYLPAFGNSYLFTDGGVERIDFVRHMRGKGVEIVGVSDSEQARLACSLVALEPGFILHYDNALDRETQLVLARKGVELVFFHPECVTAGGGSLRCMTLRLHRDAPGDRQ